MVFSQFVRRFFDTSFTETESLLYAQIRSLSDEIRPTSAAEFFPREDTRTFSFSPPSSQSHNKEILIQTPERYFAKYTIIGKSSIRSSEGPWTKFY